MVNWSLDCITVGKTPQFSCKMKLYIQNNVISFKIVLCFQMTNTNHHMNRH